MVVVQSVGQQGRGGVGRVLCRSQLLLQLLQEG